MVKAVLRLQQLRLQLVFVCFYLLPQVSLSSQLVSKQLILSVDSRLNPQTNILSSTGSTVYVYIVAYDMYYNI